MAEIDAEPNKKKKHKNPTTPTTIPGGSHRDSSAVADLSAVRRLAWSCAAQLRVPDAGDEDLGWLATAEASGGVRLVVVQVVTRLSGT